MYVESLTGGANTSDHHIQIGNPMKNRLRLVRALACMLLAAVHELSPASVGLLELAESKYSGPVTVFYPTHSNSKKIERGELSIDVSEQAPPATGNGRLIIISHGSTGAPWFYFELTQTLVNAGFVVAFPEHIGDNYKDHSEPGPESWKKRPVEVTRAIDALAKEPWFSQHLDFNQVGMYGMSAGGHTALTLAGGRWSPAEFTRHCEAHIDDDFQTCVGLITKLTGGWLDGLKTTVAKWVIRRKFSDENWYGHTDPRVVAIVAGVPLAADFDLKSLSSPHIPLGLVIAKRDKWLIPAYHSDRLLKVCSSCEIIMSTETGGHGALLSPLPPKRSGILAELIDDAPDFDREKIVPAINHGITKFFQKNLNAKQPSD